MSEDFTSFSMQDLDSSSLPLSNDGLPPLSIENVNPNNASSVDGFIDVSSQAIARLYQGLFLLQQSFSAKRDLPETDLLLQHAIQTTLIDNLATQYPEFKDFEFEINDSTIIGKSEFANTILSALNSTINTPMGEIDSLNPPPYMMATETYDYEDDESDW